MRKTICFAAVFVVVSGSGALSQINFLNTNPVLDGYNEAERFRREMESRDIDNNRRRLELQQLQDQRRASTESDHAWASVQAESARCRSTYPFNRTQVIALARCLNAAEQAILPYERHPDLWRLNHANRLVIAERVNQGVISPTVGARDWAASLSSIAAEEERRSSQR